MLTDDERRHGAQLLFDAERQETRRNLWPGQAIGLYRNSAVQIILTDDFQRRRVMLRAS